MPEVTAPNVAELEVRTIHVPLAPVSDSYAVGHLDMKLDRELRTTLRRMYDGLDQSGARLKNGKRISGPPDVIRYVLERAGVEKPDAPDAPDVG